MELINNQVLSKIKQIISSPSLFFQKNKDKEGSLIEFMTYIIRLSAVINAIGLFFIREELIIILGMLVIIILLAKVFAYVSLWVNSHVIHWIAYYIFNLDNLEGAKRAVAYATITMLIPNMDITFLSTLSVLVGLTLYTIGLSKQYKITYPKAFMITILPWFIIGVIIILITAMAGQGFVLLFG